MRARTFVFRTVEDPELPVGAEDCSLPGANLFLRGRMYALDVRADESAAELGVAVACARVDAPLVRDSVVPVHARFAFANGDRYDAEGVARVVDADVPVPGVVQAGCSLRLVGGPAGLLGGVATSASVFDPHGKLPSGTGSVWTICAYFSDEHRR